MLSPLAMASSKAKLEVSCSALRPSAPTSTFTHVPTIIPYTSTTITAATPHPHP